MIIVDADVLSYYLIQGERTAKAQQLKKLDTDWRAPSLWRAEFVSVINKYLKAKILTLDKANDVLAAAGNVYDGIDMAVDMGEVLKLAVATGASTYDAHYLALAQRTGKLLITGEKRHPGAPHGLAINIEDFLKLKESSRD